jgi:hypothetical protein
MNTFRSNTGKLFAERDHSETKPEGSITGSFFGIQVIKDDCKIGSLNPVGEAVIANLDLSSGSVYPFEFTSFRIESGSAIIYQQSTD